MFVVSKVLLFRGDVDDASKRITVQGEERLVAADVLDVSVDFLRAEVGLCDAFGLLFNEVVRLRAVGRGFVVI